MNDTYYRTDIVTPGTVEPVVGDLTHDGLDEAVDAAKTAVAIVGNRAKLYIITDMNPGSGAYLSPVVVVYWNGTVGWPYYHLAPLTYLPSTERRRTRLAVDVKTREMFYPS